MSDIYCDRNMCFQNDYNDVGCDECTVTINQKIAKNNKYATISVGDEIVLDTCHGLVTMATSDKLCIIWEGGDVGIIDKEESYILTGRNYNISDTILKFLNDYN